MIHIIWCLTVVVASAQHKKKLVLALFVLKRINTIMAKDADDTSY
jgi:hypothetical protein